MHGMKLEGSVFHCYHCEVTFGDADADGKLEYSINKIVVFHFSGRQVEHQIASQDKYNIAFPNIQFQ
jgi:hypothetical protein